MISPSLQTNPLELIKSSLTPVTSAHYVVNPPPQAYWRSNPDFRGTLNILFSCIATLVLCAWTVLHLDIPTSHEDRITKFKRKFGWFCVALFAPHILLIIAFNQHYLAKDVLKKAQAHLPLPKQPTTESPGGLIGLLPSSLVDLLYWLYEELCQALLVFLRVFLKIRIPVYPDSEGEKPRAKPRRHRWDMQHGFYTCMGGFAFDFSDDHEPPFMPGGEKHFTITPFGVVFLMKYYPDLIPDISVDSIQDRSKSDALGKTIVILQVLWFCLNLVARRASDLPISLLEVSTVAHAVSAVTIYLIWWNKPHDITLPIPIDGTKSEAREACALMSMLGPTCRPVMAGLWTLRCESELGRALEYDGVETALTETFARPRSDTAAMKHGQGEYGFRIQGGFHPHMRSRWTLRRRLANHRLSLLFGTIKEPVPPRPWYLRLVTCQLSKTEARSLLPWHARPWTQHDKAFTVDQVDRERWRLASRALFSLRNVNSELGQGNSFESHREPLLTRHSTTAYSFKYLSSFDRLQRQTEDLWSQIMGVRGTLIVSVALALYSIPHMFAWNSQFPSYEEHRAWQASALALLSPIAVIIALWVIIPPLILIYLPLQCLLGEHTTDKLIHIVLSFVEYSLLCIVLTLYPLASTYLVFESFRQLFFLSEAAYEIPPWSEIWPHVS